MVAPCSFSRDSFWYSMATSKPGASGFVGVAAQQFCVEDVVLHLVKTAVDLGPIPDVLLGTEPYFPLASVHTDQKFGQPGGVDVGPRLRA